MRCSAAILILPLLAGCAGLSGLDGESKFSCKAPDGITCRSLSSVYESAVSGSLQQKAGEGSSQQKAGEGSSQQKAGEKSDAGRIVGRPPASGDPVRIPARVLRVWIAPWEDADGDLHDQSYIYLVVHPGRWAVEYSEQRIIDRYRPTIASGGGTGAATQLGTQVHGGEGSSSAGTKDGE